ncbi:MAG: hypothetical protein V8T87_02855 [Victivallales bacterium]
MLAYEPVLVLLILAVNLRDNSFLASKVIENPNPLIFSMPLLFLAFLCVVAIEFQIAVRRSDFASCASGNRQGDHAGVFCACSSD